MKQKPIYPDLTLLGQQGSDFPKSPKSSIIETFPNAHSRRPYRITFECPEFTSVCPVTGQPDFAALTIRYIPGERCIETKSLKYYLASYRNTRSFNEDIVNRILNDLVAACAPLEMTVHGEFSPRGGISVTVDATHPVPDANPPVRQ